MAQLLKDIQLDELSLVDDGANPGARILFFKRKPTAEQVTSDLRSFFTKLKPAADADFAKMMDECAATFDEVDAADEAWENLSILWRALSSILADKTLSTDQKASMIADSLTQYLDAMSNQEATMPDVTQKQMDEAITKAVAEAIAKQKQDTDAAIAKAVEDAKKANEAATTAAIAKAKEEADKEVKKANEELAKLRDERAGEVRLAKAKSLVGKTNVSAEDVAKLLAKLDAAESEILEKVLKGASEAMEKSGLFSEAGASGGGDRGTALDELSKAAEVIKKANPTMSQAAAEAKAAEDNPALYGEYRKRQMREVAA